MTVGIATIYNCFNYGSFFQAFALQEALGQLGHAVELLNLDTPYYNRYRFRSLLSRHAGEALFNARLYLAYRADWKKLRVARRSSLAHPARYDALVVGSDEVWNVRNRTFSHVPPYFGQGVPCARVVAYAPSCGRATAEDILRHPGAADGLRGMHAVSGRDEQTVRLLAEIRGERVPQVLDPTFLIDFAPHAVATPWRDYILVYTYPGDWGFDARKIALAQAFARERGLPLVAPGFYNTWCDRVAPVSPLQFLGLLRQATHVLTDTFHGAVMSVICRKPFGVFVEGKHKLVSLLATLGLEDRCLDDRDGALAEIVSRPLDERAMEERIAPLRAQSLAFLATALASTP